MIPPQLHFALFITFLTLFLKLLEFEERDPKASAGSWFQSWMVLFTKEYLPISVVTEMPFRYSFTSTDFLVVMDMLIVLHLNPITLYLGSQAIPFWTH
jgi:hypothetical protein